jgi:Flagella basal body rod protein
LLPALSFVNNGAKGPRLHRGGHAGLLRSLKPTASGTDNLRNGWAQPAARSVTMSSSVFSVARSGLGAATARLDTAAHNIANLETPGFKRQEVAQTAQPEGGVKVSIQTAPQEGPALAQDIITQLSASYTYKANLQVLETAKQMSGTLLDTKA